MDRMLRKAVARQARELLADPTKWCKNSPALNAQDCTTPPDGAHAVRWGIDGAAMKFGGTLNVGSLLRELEEVACEVTGGQIELWELNDYKGHGAVLMVLDRYLEQ